MAVSMKATLSRPRRAEIANAAMGPMTCNQFQITSTDGLRIACARWSNQKPPREVLQIAHGMGEHIRCFELHDSAAHALQYGSPCFEVGRLAAYPKDELGERRFGFGGLPPCGCPLFPGR